MKKCIYCGAENDVPAANCTGCCAELSREPVQENVSQEVRIPAKPANVCPHCGQSENLESVVFPHKKFSWPFFLLGGIFSVIFLNGSRPRRFRCHNCEASFYVRSSGAKFMLVLLVAWLLFAWLPFVISALFLLWSGLFSK